jgi:RNA polymerase sigma-70 factor (ECF subfamily)
MLAVALHGSRDDIADAEQEVLVSLYTGLGRYRFGSSFPTFLYRLCRNKAVDLLRREARHRRTAAAAARAAASAPVADPRERLEQDERRAAVRAALDRLGDEERLLVLLGDVESLTMAEIAAITGRPQGTVKSRLHRARARLARILAEEVEP